MSGLVLASTLPEDLEQTARLSEESDDLLEEIELAQRIVKGQSAVFLLHRLGQASLGDELEETIARIYGWIEELLDAVSTKAATSELARRLVPVVRELAKGNRIIEANVRSRGVDAEGDPMALIRRAHDRLQDVLSHTPLGGVPVSNGCAAEANHLTEIRSQ